MIESRKGREYGEDKEKPHWYKEKNYCLYHQVKGHSTNRCIEMKNKLHTLLEKGKVNYVTNEESDDDEDNNMITMVTLAKDCFHAQQGKKGGNTKLFHDHDSFSNKISLYELCMIFGYHREVIYNIF